MLRKAKSLVLFTTGSQILFHIRFTLDIIICEEPVPSASSFFRFLFPDIHVTS